MSKGHKEFKIKPYKLSGPVAFEASFYRTSHLVIWTAGIASKFTGLRSGRVRQSQADKPTGNSSSVDLPFQLHQMFQVLIVHCEEVMAVNDSGSEL